MPKTLNVAPKDLYVTIEFSAKELKLLEKGLFLANIEYDGTIIEERKAANYTTDVFYTFIKELIKEIKEYTE